MSNCEFITSKYDRATLNKSLVGLIVYNSFMNKIVFYSKKNIDDVLYVWGYYTTEEYIIEKNNVVHQLNQI